MLRTVLFALAIGICSAKLGGRLTNSAKLFDCDWTTGKFNCAGSKNVNFTNTLGQQTSSQIGNVEITERSNAINVKVTTSATHMCLVVDYCLSGANSRLTVENEFSYSPIKQVVFPRQLTDGGECRELIQTINDVKPTPHTYVITTITAQLFGLPSSFFFDRISIYDGACRVRLEGDYFREFGQYLTSNYGIISKEVVHDDDYLAVGTKQPFIPKWPTGVVPYLNSLTKDRKQMLADAFKAIESVSCVRFTEIKTPSGAYVEISDKNAGCYTEELAVTGTRVLMNMADECWQPRTVLHQLMHVLAFNHESNRPDRDFYVKVNSANVQTGKINEFDVHDAVTSATFNLPYDYSSIMHFKGNEFSNSTANTLESTKASTMQLGGDVLSPIDATKLQSGYCSKSYTCVTDTCPYDSKCIDSKVGCSCITEAGGNPGGCQSIMDPHLSKDCGPTGASLGKVVEVGALTQPLCICKKDGYISSAVCPIATVNIKEKREAPVTFTNRATCTFGYRQLPTICDPVPEAVQISLTALKLLLPESLSADQSISKLAGLKVSELATWTNDLSLTSSTAYLKASKAVRFEILRALSLIYNGDDSLITKTSNFDVASLKQEPWIDPLNGAVKFSKTESDTFGISVIVYFTQPIYHNVAWLESRLISIFGLDSAERDNGFVFMQGKASVTVEGDVCKMFSRPYCASGSYCQRGYSFGKLATCTAKPVIVEPTTTKATTKPTQPPTKPPVTTTPAPPEERLTDTEIALIVVCCVLGTVLIIILLWLLCCRKGEKSHKSQEIELVVSPSQHKQPPPPQPVYAVATVQPHSPPISAVSSPSPQPTPQEHYTNQGYYSPTPGQEVIKPVAF